ncbi:MAG: glycosyltransferase [bacterium]
MPYRLLMTGGGTRGTLSPLLAVADEIRRRDPQTVMHFCVTNTPSEKAFVEEAGYSAEPFPAGKWRRYVDLRNVVDLAVVVLAFFRALVLLRRFHPDIIVSAGSFLSVPIAWAAAVYRLPVLIHQQDVELGFANKLMSWTASMITVTNELTLKKISQSRATRVTGNPVRSSMVTGDANRARHTLSIADALPVLLVLGGSSGARFFAELLAATYQRLVGFCQIVHVAGRSNVLQVPEHARYRRLPFLERDLADVLALADVVVTRAGFSTLSELAATAKCCVIIPMPKTHQEANARYFQDHRAAIVLDQATLAHDDFVATIHNLIQHPQQRAILGQKMHACSQPNATQRVADEVISILQRHGSSS